ncbi:MAG: PAS domain S-box protein [Deltaproteobacteria bacterium]|nr:PAS domain S-box protein [Deltaproteobacteria bacterium]
MMTRSGPKDPLQARLLAMMVLRAAIALAFLGISSWFQLRVSTHSEINFHPLYAVVIAIASLTIVYALLIKRVSNLRLFSYVQIAVDTALITAIVYVTGATQSYLQTLYPLAVIGGAILLNRRGGYFAASLASISFGVLVDMDLYGMLPMKYMVFYAPPAALAWKDALTTVSSNILAFFTIAYLTGYLAERMARVERALEEREVDLDKLSRLNRHIVENITSGIMTLDDGMRITSFNREAENVTGYSIREVYGRQVNDIFPDMISPGAALSQPESRVERGFRKKGGEEMYLGFTVSRGQGGDVARIVIFQDLTRLKEMEERIRRDDKLRALGELSVGIAHEIRNPLASISGSIQLLKEDLNLNAEDRRLIDIATRETERLNSLVTDFLLFAKPAQRNADLVDLNLIISETMELFKNSPDAAALRLESDMEKDIFVKGNSRQLGQIFWNLFLNAAHAMRDGGRVMVSAHAVDKAASGRGARGDNSPSPPFAKGGIVEITVADTGEGIKPEHINRIFDPFFSTKDSGTGLGLAIVHRIVESHGGAIEVKSRAGSGTVFRITLPLARQGESCVRA